MHANTMRSHEESKNKGYKRNNTSFIECEIEFVFSFYFHHFYWPNFTFCCQLFITSYGVIRADNEHKEYEWSPLLFLLIVA